MGQITIHADKFVMDIGNHHFYLKRRLNHERIGDLF